MPSGQRGAHASHTYWLGTDPGFFPLGCRDSGVVGTLYFGAAASAIGRLISWWDFREALRESDSVLIITVRQESPPARNEYQRPDVQAGLPGALYPDEEFAGPAAPAMTWLGWRDTQ